MPHAEPYCLPLPGLHQHLASSGIPIKGGIGLNDFSRGLAEGMVWDERNRHWVKDPALCELQHHLARHNIRFVVFDMDLTVTARHTRGTLTRNPNTMASYLASACETDALKTMRLCRSMGIHIGIATFQREVDDDTHIGGSHLVRRVLGAIGAGDLVSDSDVIALSSSQYADMLRHQDHYSKNDLIRMLFERRGQQYAPGSTLLIDDTRRNVEAFVRIGGHGLLVEGGQGLKLENTKVMEPSCTFVPGMTFASTARRVAFTG